MVFHFLSCLFRFCHAPSILLTDTTADWAVTTRMFLFIDGDDDDSPMIQGFSDDEPLVIA